jgi:hypothetical protein
MFRKIPQNEPNSLYFHYITAGKLMLALMLSVSLWACKTEKQTEVIDNPPPAAPVINDQKIRKSNTFKVTKASYVPPNQWIPLQRNLDTFGFYKGVVILPHYVHFKHDVVPITFKLKTRKSVAQVSFEIFSVAKGSKNPLFKTTLTSSGEEEGWVLYTYRLDSKTLETSNWPDEIGAKFMLKKGMGAVATFRYVQAEAVLSQIYDRRYVGDNLIFPAKFTQIRSSGRYKLQCSLFDRDGHPIAQSVSRGDLGEKDSIDIVFDKAVIGEGLEEAKVRDCMITKINPPGVGATYGRVEESAYHMQMKNEK